MTPRIRYNHWWFRFFPGGGVVLWPYVLFKRSEEEVSDKLFAHEMVHVQQIRTEGAFIFYLKYLLFTIRYGYWNNPYEVEARAIAEEFS